MRLIVDTNILISALLVDASLPAHLIGLRREGRFDLLTSAEQLDELMRVTRYPKIRNLPAVTVSPDPDDTYLLALAAAGAADFLVAGDKRDLLGLKLYEGARIVTVRDFLTLNRRSP